MEFLFLFAGLGIGFLVGWLLFRNRAAGTVGGDTSALEKRILDLEKAKIVAETNLQNAQNEYQRLSQELKTTKEDNATELSSEREKLSAANNRLARAEEAFKLQNEKLAAQKTEIEDLQKKLTVEFENIANRILDEKSKKFTEQNKVNLDGILTPLRDKIKDFEERVEKSYKTESDERIALKVEIKNLVELNNRISKEANNLASALKGDNQAQGGWGEMILEKILENSGLEEGREYRKQFVTRNDDGEIIKPDIVIELPDSKQIIVDSKVSLTAYESYVNNTDIELRPKFLKAHIESLKTHVKSLSEKKYQTSDAFNTPDMVLLFVPIESSFAVAVQADVDLFHYAWEKKIVIVSPSTLLATLRTIASLWKQERQNRNVMEIARISGNLYDEFHRFIEDLKDIDKHLGRSQEAYQSAMKRLTTGKGNLLRTAEKIRKLGARTQQSLDKTLLEKAHEKDESENESSADDEQTEES